MKKIVQAHLFVSGTVQGVFFRSYTQEVARGLDLTGWVRNLRDGRVEIMVEGPEDKVKKLIEWCYTGPPSASVVDIETIWLTATGRFTDFDIKYES